MWDFVKTVISEFATPEKFGDDWKGFIHNQFGHTGIGIFAVWIACLISFTIMGDLPSRFDIFLGIAFLYSTKELVADKWNGFDTVEDFLFVVVYGAGGTLAAFKQMEQNSADVVFNIHSAVPFLTACFIHLFAGAFYRWNNARHNRIS